MWGLNHQRIWVNSIEYLSCKANCSKTPAGTSKPGRSTSVLQSALQRGQLALELLPAEQTALAVSSSFPWHTNHSGQEQLLSLCKFLLLGEEIWFANPPVHYRQPFPELLSTVHSLPRSLQGLHRGDTSFFLFVLFKSDAFCNVLCKTWTSCCLLGVGRCEIQIYAMLILSCSVKTVVWVNGKVGVNSVWL